MINGEGDLNLLIYNQLGTVELDQGPSGGPPDLQAVPIFVSIPEEEVVADSLIPGIMFWYFDDVELQGRPHRSPGDIKRRVDENDITQGWDVLDRPSYRRLYYQLDLYTHSYQDMIRLSQIVLSRLRREFGALTDDDENVIYYRLEDVNDGTRDIEEERLFKRSMTYSFDAWVLEDESVQGHIGVVEYINTQIYDMSTEEELSNEWIPDDPPS